MKMKLLFVGFFVQSVFSLNIFSCPDGCNECGFFGTCLACKPGYGLYDGECHSCSVGTFGEGGVSQCLHCPKGTNSTIGSSHCFICPLMCRDCLSNGMCMSCEVGYGLYNGKCEQCEEGFYNNGGISQCQEKKENIFKRLFSKPIENDNVRKYRSSSMKNDVVSIKYSDALEENEGILFENAFTTATYSMMFILFVFSFFMFKCFNRCFIVI